MLDLKRAIDLKEIGLFLKKRRCSIKKISHDFLLVLGQACSGIGVCLRGAKPQYLRTNVLAALCNQIVILTCGY